MNIIKSMKDEIRNEINYYPFWCRMEKCSKWRIQKWGTTCSFSKLQPKLFCLLQGVPQNTHHFVLSNFLTSLAATIKSRDISDMSSACSYRICYFLCYLFPRCNFVQDITKRATRSLNWNWQNDAICYIYWIQCLTVSRRIPLVSLGFLMFFLYKSFKLKVHVNLKVA